MTEMTIHSWVHITNVASDWLLALMALLCSLGHIAVLRSPDYQESFTRESIRRIKIAGFSLLTIRWWYVLLFDTDLLIPAPTVMGMTLVLGAEFFMAVYLLFSGELEAHCEQRHLKGSL